MLNAFRNRGQPGEEQTDELLSAYLDGVLDLNERATLEARLQEDRDLLARLNVLRQTKKALAQLPQVAVPRNFILSPSMTGVPRSAPPKLRRRTWPAFGWATAAVTLLFLLVFAGDVFVVAPSQRVEPAQIAAQQAPIAREAESLPDVAEKASLGVQVTVEVEREEIVAPTNEKQAYAAEQEAPVEAPLPAAEAEALPPAAGQRETLVGESAAPVAEAAEEESTADADEMRLQSATSATIEGAVESAQETPPAPATSTPGPEATPMPETKAAIIAATSPATAEVETAAPPVASPTAMLEATEAEIGPETLPERAATPDAVAVLIMTPDTAASASEADDVHTWLRVAEFGLGLAVIGLALATLMVRRRES
jgi:hypothetical protein